MAQEKQPTKVKFRAGEVLAAEISSTPQKIQDVNPLEQEMSIRNKAYAVIFVKLDKARSIGIYDYALSDSNMEYQCLAINDIYPPLFDNSKWEYITGTDGKVFMLLFIVNCTLPKDGKPVKYTLKSKLFDNTIVNPVIEFKNIGNAAFSNPQAIPPEGNLGVLIQAPATATKPSASVTVPTPVQEPTKPAKSAKKNK